MTWWFVSFTGPAGPLGGALIQIPAGQSGVVAIRRAWELGINPGGEVIALRLPTPVVEEHTSESHRNRLLSETEMAGMTFGSRRWAAG